MQRTLILAAIGDRDVRALRAFAEDPNLDEDNAHLLAGYAEQHLDLSIAKRIVKSGVAEPNALWLFVLDPIMAMLDRDHPDLVEAIEAFAYCADQWTVETTHMFASVTVKRHDIFRTAILTAAERTRHPAGFLAENMFVFLPVDEELLLDCEKAIAVNRHTPGLQLANWHDHDEFEIRKAVAYHPNTPPEVLEVLAEEFPISDRLVA
ncbi:hypothetical protein AB3M81_08130 [Aeromicrobium sp. 179-A 4D2 NHS]